MKKKLILLAFALLFTFLILEVGLRLLGFSSGIYRTDSTTGLTTLNPSSEFYWIKDCFKNLVATNSLGFHDQEFKEEKDQNTFRIVVLGDSYVEALQINRDKSFHNLLEKKLNESFPEKKFEIYAIGKSGNGSYANYLFMKNYALKYHPDLIIDAFLFGNDFRDDSQDLGKLYVEQTMDTVVYANPYPQFSEHGELLEPKFVSKSSEKSKLRSVASKSALLTFLYTKYNTLKTSKQTAKLLNEAKDTGVVEVDKQVFLKDYSQVWNIAWIHEETLLKKMNQTAKTAGAKFAVVSLAEGYRTHFPDKQTEGFDYNKPENLLGQIAERNQIPYLPLLPKFQERFKQENKQTTFDCDAHWNELGHEYAAEIMLDYFQNHRELLNLNPSDIITVP